MFSCVRVSVWGELETHPFGGQKVHCVFFSFFGVPFVFHYRAKHFFFCWGPNSSQEPPRVRLRKVEAVEFAIKSLALLRRDATWAAKSELGVSCFEGTLPPTDMAHVERCLEEQIPFEGTPCQLPCEWEGGYSSWACRESKRKFLYPVAGSPILTHTLPALMQAVVTSCDYQGGRDERIVSCAASMCSRNSVGSRKKTSATL